MVARPLTGPHVPVWYTTNDLAALWQVHPVTIRRWLMVLRRQGLGPHERQSRIVKRNSARRFRVYEAEYAIFMHDTMRPPMK